ncbi:MAG: DUF5320 domain-containing protein [Candidatus Eisenbacteria bacterium]
MPGGDRTGPSGLGARTGRGGGYCSGYGMPGYANLGRAGGFGGGRGGDWGGGAAWGGGLGRSGARGGGAARGCGGASGRGWCHWFHATGLPGWMRFPTSQSRPASDPGLERKALENEAAALQTELAAIKKRLDELESSCAT